MAKQCPHCGEFKHGNHIPRCPKNPKQQLTGISKRLHEEKVGKKPAPKPKPAPKKEPEPEPEPEPEHAPEPQEKPAPKSKAPSILDNIRYELGTFRRAPESNPTKETRESEPREEPPRPPTGGTASRDEAAPTPAKSSWLGTSSMKQTLTVVTITAAAIFIGILIARLFTTERPKRKPEPEEQPPEQEINREDMVFDVELQRLVPRGTSWEAAGAKKLPDL